MDLNKYKNDGWGLSYIGFQQIENHLLSLFDSGKSQIKVIEFGSGTSTQFLIDFKHFYNKDLVIHSFENDKYYAFKPDQEYQFLKLSIVELVHCSKKRYNTMFETLNLERTKFRLYPKKPHPRQTNCFYDIRPEALDTYDFVILDGPNGNGRNLAWLHLKDHLNNGAIIFIDDFNHYDFVEKMKLVFPNTKEIFKHESENNNKCTDDQYMEGGQIVIFKIDE